METEYHELGDDCGQCSETTLFAEALSGAPAPLKRITKQDRLVDIIQSMVSNGLLRDGDELPGERELGEIFGVSRQTIRAALSKLNEKGLVNIHQGAKTKVTVDDNKPLEILRSGAPPTDTTLDKRSVVDVFEARKVIELSIARLAATRCKTKHLEQMETLITQQRNLFSDPAHFQLSDHRFHMLIGKAGGNPILYEHSAYLYNFRLGFRRRVMEQPGAIENSYHEHVEIFTAIAKGDEKIAERAMHRHLESVYKSTINTMSIRFSE